MVALEDTGKRLVGVLSCGHRFETSRKRQDLFDALRDKRPVHCWDCDRLASVSPQEGK